MLSGIFDYGLEDFGREMSSIAELYEACGTSVFPALRIITNFLCEELLLLWVSAAVVLIGSC